MSGTAKNRAAAAVSLAVTTALLCGCGGKLRHIAGHGEGYDPGEARSDYVRLGSLQKPVGATWVYRVTEPDGSEYESEVAVIAVAPRSYKLRERNDKEPEMEYYYEYGLPDDGYRTITLEEDYRVGGVRVTRRYDPPLVYLPDDGVLEPGLRWGYGSVSVGETTRGHRMHSTREYNIPGKTFTISRIVETEVPAGRFFAAEVTEQTRDGTPIKTEYLSNIGLIKQVEFTPDGTIIRNKELTSYTYPDIEVEEK